jgi:hypothetical protein
MRGKEKSQADFSSCLKSDKARDEREKEELNGLFLPLE